MTPYQSLPPSPRLRRTRRHRAREAPMTKGPALPQPLFHRRRPRDPRLTSPAMGDWLFAIGYLVGPSLAKAEGRRFLTTKGH